MIMLRMIITVIMTPGMLIMVIRINISISSDISHVITSSNTMIRGRVNDINNMIIVLMRGMIITVLTKRGIG